MKYGSQGEAVLAARIRAAGLPEPALQHAFAAALKRKWRFDFAWPELRVAAEFDGGARMVRWQRNPRTGRQQPVAVGRHGSSSDYDKLNAAAFLGWKVYRFNGDMLRRPDALRWLVASLCGQQPENNGNQPAS
jgi:hypothetical protein